MPDREAYVLASVTNESTLRVAFPNLEVARILAWNALENVWKL
jgi:hypothetical protein